MIRAKIAGIGHYVPENVVTNKDLSEHMDTSDEWIQERTGIKERRFGTKHDESTTTMGYEASKIALDRAGITAEEVEFIIFATLSPDYYFPGCGVLLQRALGISKTEIGALDVRNQCSGFVYALSVADQYIRSGMYKNILVVGAEMHSMGLEFTTRGRGVSVIFGDGAGAAVVQATEEDRGILVSELHSDGTNAEMLALLSPGSHGGVHHEDKEQFGFPDQQTLGGTFITEKMLENGHHFPFMDGKSVFKKAVVKFPEVIKSTLDKIGKTSTDIDLLVPHQANLRISQFVQKTLGLKDEQVFNNIEKYGNTTAASIPIALSEAWEQGRVKDGALVCLAAFGSGFTWGSVIIKW